MSSCLEISLTDCPLEQSWRACRAGEPGVETAILASRWLDRRQTTRWESASAPADRYVLSLALRSTKLRLLRGAVTLSDGRMPAGTLHVTEPAQALEAEFQEPCDFLHFYVAADCITSRARDLGLSAEGLDATVLRDPVAAQLGRSLVEAGANAGGQHYVESVGQTIVTRVLMARPQAPSVSPLPKWRLRRVHAFIEANIAEPVTLQQMAAAAGLSRMHFAAQFRTATGMRPHDYLLQQRIEYAKAAIASGGLTLAAIALDAGFQTQSHFSTVFKRLSGDTPGQWRRTSAVAAPASPRSRRFDLTRLGAGAQHAAGQYAL